LQDVRNFFFKYYRPVNAILVVAGNVTTEGVKVLAENWFGSIESGEKYVRQLPAEPPQTSARKLEVYADVPLDALYKTWHMGARLDKGYYIADLITEVLGGGGSSRLYQRLVKEKQLFSNIECHQDGTVDAGLLTIEGKLVKGVKMEDAERAVEEELETLRQHAITEAELQKVKNKTESIIAFEDMSVLNRANSLAFYELLGDADLINTELQRYQQVTVADIQAESNSIFTEANSSTLYYHSKN
jgi:zinc protease